MGGPADADVGVAAMIRNERESAWFVVVVFTVVGLGLALVDYVVANWATVQFVSAAGGRTPEQFGPVFVASLALGTVALSLVAGTLLAGVLGVLVGSRHPTRQTVVSTGGGSVVGFALLAGLSVAGVHTGVTGPAATQLFTVGQAVGPVATAAVVAGLVGAAGALVGGHIAG